MLCLRLEIDHSAPRARYLDSKLQEGEKNKKNIATKSVRWHYHDMMGFIYFNTKSIDLGGMRPIDRTDTKHQYGHRWLRILSNAHANGHRLPNGT